MGKKSKNETATMDLSVTPLIDFSDPCLRSFLPVLLQDHTTGKNIIWATEPPPELGAGFTDEITLEQIKRCPPVPRVLKRLDEQKQRTKAKAEVFTPSWVCKKMIDMGEENGAMPDMKKEPIKYIHSTVLEITCGEAPFLVNRYDTVTGKKISVPKRKGLFDRKLKCVNNWFDWNVWTWHDVAEDAATTTSIALCGCTEASRVNHNISQQAKNFNVTRRLSVVNARTDTPMLEIIGNMDISNNGNNELVVTIELPDGTYKKHYVYLNEYTMYIVEDLSGSDVDKYHYEINILPQQLQNFVLTYNP